MKCKARLLLSIVICFILVNPAHASTQFHKQYIDCPTSHPYYESITHLAELGIVSGTSSKTMSPDSPITGYEYITVLMRLFYPELTYAPSGTWYTPYLNAASNMGILSKITPDASDLNKPCAWATIYSSALIASKSYPYPACLFTAEATSGSTLLQDSLYSLLDMGLISSVEIPAQPPTRGEVFHLLYQLSICDYDGPDLEEKWGLTDKNFVVEDIEHNWEKRNSFLKALPYLPEKYMDYFLSSGWVIRVADIQLSHPDFPQAVGLTCFHESTIYIDSTSLTTPLHEFGHFLSLRLGTKPYLDTIYQNQDEVEALSSFCGDYCKTNAKENFAVAFAYALLHSEEGAQCEMAIKTPQLYRAIMDGMVNAQGLYDKAVFDTLYRQ